MLNESSDMPYLFSGKDSCEMLRDYFTRASNCPDLPWTAWEIAETHSTQSGGKVRRCRVAAGIQHSIWKLRGLQRDPMIAVLWIESATFVNNDVQTTVS